MDEVEFMIFHKTDALSDQKMAYRVGDWNPGEILK